MQRMGAVLLTAVLGLTATYTGSRLERMAGERTLEEQLLYLPNGKYLKLASLGQAPLVADLIYLWAIQYYSNYQREDRFRYVEHVFSEVIAELDPHSIDTYWLGAMILSVEAHDLEGALRLLDKGFVNNPDSWILPYMAGWECHGAAQYTRAASYFDTAAAVVGAPMAVKRMRAGMIGLAGDARQAIRLWLEVAEDPTSDADSIKIAHARIRDLKGKADIADLAEAIEAFRTRNGRVPFTLEELQRTGYIRKVPTDPDGNEYHYDSSTGGVTSGSRILSE